MSDSVSGRQIKAARALLGWKRDALAARAGVTAPTVQVIEADDSLLEALTPTRDRLVEVLQAEHVVFTTGSAPGVQVVPAEAGLQPDELNASNDD